MAALAQSQIQFNSWPLQPTKVDLDWTAFALIFIFGASIGAVVLYRFVTCCVEHSTDEVMA